MAARWREAENDVVNLVEEIAKLKADRARLDWLLSSEGAAWSYWVQTQGLWNHHLFANRKAIDEAMERRP